MSSNWDKLIVGSDLKVQIPAISSTHQIKQEREENYHGTVSSTSSQDNDEYQDLENTDDSVFEVDETNSLPSAWKSPSSENICKQLLRDKKYKYRPKPLGKKNSRSFVPEEQKNKEYWEKRIKNNVAARKSREDRRRKELETLERKKNMEKDNLQLKMFIQKLQSENQYLLYERAMLRESKM